MQAMQISEPTSNSIHYMEIGGTVANPDPKSSDQKARDLFLHLFTKYGIIDLTKISPQEASWLQASKRSVRELELPNVALTKDDLDAIIEALPSIQKLYIRADNLNDEQLGSSLALLSDLAEARVDGCSQLTAKFLTYLHFSGKLKNISLKGTQGLVIQNSECNQVTPEMIKAKHIYFGSAKVRDAVKIVMYDHPTLDCLVINGQRIYVNKPDDGELEQQLAGKKLRSANYFCNRLTDKSLDLLAKQDCVEKLHLNSAYGFTREGLKKLVSCVKMKELLIVGARRVLPQDKDALCKLLYPTQVSFQEAVSL